MKYLGFTSRQNGKPLWIREDQVGRRFFDGVATTSSRCGTR